MKKRKAFPYGFLVLAMITLLSGMVQSNNRVASVASVYALDNSPPAMLPAFDLNVNFTSPAVTWLCRSMPGSQDQNSVVICLTAINTDVLSTNHQIKFNSLKENPSNDHYIILTSDIYARYLELRSFSVMINTYKVNPRFETVSNYIRGANTRLTDYKFSAKNVTV